MNSTSPSGTLATTGRHLAAMVAWLAVAWVNVPAAAAADSSRPNLILFLIDDQDYESIAAFGGKTWTPNLDRMAAEGMKFTRAHVSSTVCTPSRYSWLTGRYAGASTSKVYQDDRGGVGVHRGKQGPAVLPAPLYDTAAWPGRFVAPVHGPPARVG